MSNTPVTNFRLPAHLKDRARELAAERGLTLTDAVIEALNDWIRKQERRR